DLRGAPALAATEMAVAGVQPAKPSPEPVNTEVESLVLRLATANRELEAFSYFVSHDLRTPLRAIDGFSRALLDHYSSTLDVRGRDYLARICNAAQRMAQLIDDLLKLARVSRSELKRHRLDLTQEALTVVDLLRSAHPAREVSVTVASDLIVDADLRLLRIILENLLGNAWKFTARTENASITLGSRVIDGASVFFVADNGAGFDMAYADQLFGVFQRLHSTDQFEGTGVGLATVQRVLQMHGGRIWAEAAVDRGATFFFTLESPSLQAQNYERGVA
ncbi:MAG TPA: ATP-binding protein, partial [Thermoanaerobaculia bacterium]